jgi:uncharacterized membrane protein
MRRLIDHAVRLSMTGLLVLVPVFLAVFVLGELFGLLEAVAEPLALALPMETIAGIDVRYVISLLTIVLVCYALGALLETRAGQGANAWLDDKVFDRIPGYSLARSLTHGVAGRHDEQKFQVGLAQLVPDGALMMGLIVERQADGWLTFFVPQAPTPTLGNVYIVHSDRVEELNVPATSLLNCVMQWGIGSSALRSSGTEIRS